MARANIAQEQPLKEYKHIDYVSSIAQKDCFICGTNHDYTFGSEDNVGIVNLNAFELLYLEINRYDEHGNLVQAQVGYMSSNGLIDDEAGTYVHAYSHPDRAYANVQLTGVQYAIDRNSIQSRLCQTCLDSINGLWFTDQAPAEFAVISFEDRTVQPLLNAHPLFAAGNFGVDCVF